VLDAAGHEDAVGGLEGSEGVEGSVHFGAVVLKEGSGDTSALRFADARGAEQDRGNLVAIELVLC